jgi:hypothetical protein
MQCNSLESAHGPAFITVHKLAVILAQNKGFGETKHNKVSCSLGPGQCLL